MILRKSYVMPRAGAISHLELKEDALGDPAPDEVQIVVRAIGLNFADIFAMFGIYSATPKGSFTPGLEYAGIVVKKGKNVIYFQEGQEVMGVTRFGAYTTHLNIPAQYVVPLPQGWTAEEGAAFLVQSLTAYYALVNLGAMQENKTVLIHSAAGGVGIMAHRIAKQFNAFTIGTIGSDHKVDFLKKEGYDRIIVRGKQFATDLTKALEGRKLDLILECIGGKTQKESFAQLSAQGRMIVYGAAQYASPGKRPNYAKLLYYYLNRPKIDPQAMIQQNRSVMAFNLIWLYENHELMMEIVDELLQMDIGKPHIGHRFDFTDLPLAIQEFQSGQTIGKVVINVN